MRAGHHYANDMRPTSDPDHKREGVRITHRFDALRSDTDAGAKLALTGLVDASRAARPHLHVERALAHALRSRWDRAAAVVRCASDFLLLDPALALFGDVRALRAGAAHGERLSAADSALVDAAIDHAAASELFAALVQCAPVNDLRIERLLLALRGCLHAVVPSTPQQIRVAAMIATQARWVEYLWPDVSTTAPPAAPSTAVDEPAARTRAIRALVDAMFRPSGVADLNALGFLAREPAVHELLALIRDEPAIEARYRRQLELAGFDAPLERDGGERIARHRTRRTPPSASDASGTAHPRALPPAVRALAGSERFDRPRFLLVGCGDAREPVTVQATWSGAHITAIDWSATKLVHAMRTWEFAGHAEDQPGAVDFVATDLLDIPSRGVTYDVVQCTANAHYLPNSLAGCAALASCTNAGSLLRLVVSSEAARRHLHALQVALEEHGSVYGLAELRTLREELFAGRYGQFPSELLDHPDFFTASGMRRLLFAHDDDVPETAGWIRLLEPVGFDFVGVEANEVLTHAARTVGHHDCEAWSLRDWERFERGRPPMFGGEYSLWFVRLAAGAEAGDAQA